VDGRDKPGHDAQVFVGTRNLLPVRKEYPVTALEDRPPEDSVSKQWRSSPMRLGIIVAIVTLLLDQATKWWVLGPLALAEQGRIRIAPSLDFVLVWNTGISYGLFRSDGVAGRVVFTLIAVGATVFLSVWLRRESRPANAAALGLLIGGAIGNGIDRVVHGAVVDFVLFHVGGFEWYVFNIADAAIVVGVAMLLVSSLLPVRISAT
jgi:signal peptidase II